MIKLVDPYGYDRMSEPPIEMVKMHSRGLEKTAALVKHSHVLQKYMDKLEPIPGHTPIHMIGVNDLEKLGANRNGDAFREEVNKKYYDTFTKYAHVFDNHDNKDPKKRSGIVKASEYNPRMGRIEILSFVDNKKWAPELEKLASGDKVGVSMACHVSYDTCSICKNKAPNPSYYCNHIKYARCRILDDGRQVYMDNPDPRFFDISRVHRPADRGAYAIYKAASAGLVDPSGLPLLAADMAKQAGIVLPPVVKADTCPESFRRRYQLLNKLAEMEKHVPAQAQAPTESGKTLRELARVAKIKNLSKKAMDELTSLGRDKSSDVLGALSKAHVMLSVPDFVKLLLGRETKPFEEDMIERVTDRLPGIFNEMADEDPMETCCEALPDLEMPSVISKLGPELEEHMMAGKPVEKRVRVTVIREGNAPPKVTVKKSSVSEDHNEAIGDISKLYAKYALAVLDRCRPGEENLVTSLIVLNNTL